GSNIFGWNRSDVSSSMSPRSRPILDCAASTLFACTVGRRHTPRPAPSAFLWNSFARLLGLESIRDGDGNIIRRAPLPVWANLRQRALDTAIRAINAKTDLHIQLESLERSAHRRVTAVTLRLGLGRRQTVIHPRAQKS